MTWRILTPIAKARQYGRGKPSKAAREALGDKFATIVRADMLGGFERIRSSANYGDIADAIYSGDASDVLTAIDPDTITKTIKAAMRNTGKAMSESADMEVKAVGSIGMVDPSALSLRPDNPAISDYLDIRTGALVQGISDDLQVGIQAAVRDGITNRLSPREVADQIMQTKLGLTQGQQLQLDNYTKGLQQQGMTKRQVASLSTDFRDALRDQRAVLIAQTESAFAVNAGQQAVWDTAREAGLMPEDAQKMWVTEANPCPRCAAMSGVRVPLDEPFVTGEGIELDGPPMHPRCRCNAALA